jgi:hypothetical protein
VYAPIDAVFMVEMVEGEEKLVRPSSCVFVGFLCAAQLMSTDSRNIHVLAPKSKADDPSWNQLLVA